MSAVGQETDFNWGMSKKSYMRYTFWNMFYSQLQEKNVLLAYIPKFNSASWLIFDKIKWKALLGQNKIGFMK